MEFSLLTNLEEWNKLNSFPKSKEIIIFKFSPTCPISFMVEKKFDNWLSNINNDLEIDAYKVDVINSKALSQTIADEYKIKHESPQIIWLDKKGRVKWNASHYSITKGSLEENLTGEKVGFLRKIFQ